MTLHVPWHLGNTKRTVRVSANESATGKIATANAEPTSNLSLYFPAKKVSRSEEEADAHTISLRVPLVLSKGHGSLASKSS